MIEGYLLDREPLEMVFVLVDGEIGPTPLDVQMLDWLRDNEVPHTVVATKTDKVKSSQRQRRKRELAEGCRLDPGDVVWVSATKGASLDQLRASGARPPWTSAAARALEARTRGPRGSARGSRRRSRRCRAGSSPVG